MRLLPITLLIGLLLNILASAQDDIPAPQFLYRDDNRLILINGYTGEETELPIGVAEADRFEWSPDGQHLLAWIAQGEFIITYCLNIYDVDALAWLYNKPIACAVTDAEFSATDAQIAYSTNEENNGVLWLFSLAGEASTELYRTQDGEELRRAGIFDIQWSPTESYLTFVSYNSILGGTLNYFKVMNLESRNYIDVNAPAAYYASFHPIWSADDRWFLIILKEEYVTSGVLAHTNHEGDVYLINSETGDKYRLTYTPAVFESEVHWTEGGGIAFSVTTVQQHAFTLEQAMNVEVVVQEDIITPEPINPQEYFDTRSNVMVSPDVSLGAWFSYASHELGGDLNIGYVYARPFQALFTIPIPESYRYDGSLIGWRPSNYSYPQG